MSAVRLYETSDWVSAFAIAAIAQIAFIGMMSSPERPALQMDISDEKAQPVAVQITPVPLLKQGSKTPQALPKEWQRQVAPPVKKQEETPLPSTQAEKTPEAIPSSHVPDAAVAPVVTDAATSAPVDPAAQPTDAAAAAPAASSSGDPNGSPNGTETDPNKARAVNIYRNQLAAFFLARFAIRGKVPFEKLEKLRGTAIVQVSGDRSVAGFSIASPSGDPTFDAEMKNALQSRVGATLPPPPPLYPDILGQSFPVAFSCPIKAQCE